ncbi:uncharacterized protein NFIA_114970 [Aspergillus fischeri NRRL 181]|uniref:Uncharacterized protein n=1 Tax=Neosartorya fischeri (strain ATCC 1020 / DSM 3700 / CBS 544.65 / FGSC A1164 / JCM 1740 / NRRL 181 / WB 181) TaxID=331117 RepID=A1D9A3_NEOFI|nr:uncharacterized protein NFIA_114970 [Aspergillus fischeri NRRL 181]EAW20964.1 hypothetical protein NFIA_114970 [Aspergillus fischeri NRRL 181]
MDSAEKSNRLAFGVTSFPSSTPHQDSNQSGPNHQIGFTFRPPQTCGGFSQWASGSAGLLNTSFSGDHAPDVSEKANPSSPACKMELNASENTPSTVAEGAPGASAVVVRGEQERDSPPGLLASGAIASDQAEMSEVISLVPVAAGTSRAYVVFESQKVPGNCLPLGSLDISTLSSDKVLYYFGVLAIQALLLPKFQCDSSRRRGFWKGKLTLYGLTFESDYSFHTPLQAKSAMARKALEKLLSPYSSWTVPPEPMDCPLTTGWSWTDILKDYCIQNGLPEPTYTKYNHKQGCRHEAQVANFSRFGVLKHYTKEWNSKNSAAQMTLYALLTFGQLPPDGISGAAALRNFDEGLLVVVPRETFQAGISNGNDSSKGPRKRLGEDHASKGQAKKRVVKGSSEGVNANLLPLAGNSRLAPIEEHEQNVEKRWSVSYRELESALERGWETFTGKLQRICQLLSLEVPEIRIERNNGHMKEGDYKAAAYFGNDPFLRRASPIGESKGSMSEAKEACARKVTRYLIEMVREDTRLEDEAAKEIERIRNWGGISH